MSYTSEVLGVGLGPDDRVRFDGKSTSWRVRAQGTRYTLLTASLFGAVHYTIIDRERLVRGPMNVIGWGLGIFTTSGPDEQVDRAMAMLEGRDDSGLALGTWEVSRRGEVPLEITDWRRA